MYGLLFSAPRLTKQIFTHARHPEHQKQNLKKSSHTGDIINISSLHSLLSDFISFYFISFHFISFYFISFYFISFFFISFHLISFHTGVTSSTFLPSILYYLILFHFIFYFLFISFFFISFHLISFHTGVTSSTFLPGQARRGSRAPRHTVLPNSR